jgi:hypothetical protein
VEETSWISVLAMGELWHQPWNVAQGVSSATSYLRIQHTNLCTMLYYDESLLVSILISYRLLLSGSRKISIRFFFNVMLCEFLDSSCGILKLMISALSAHCTAWRNGHRLLILGWNALYHPGSYSSTFSHVPNCTRTRRISRW